MREELLGYSYNADIYCINCADLSSKYDNDSNEKHPIFNYDEKEYEEFCCICHERLESDTIIHPQSIDLIEDRKFPDINWSDVESLRLALIESVKNIIISEREYLSDYKNSDIDGYEILIHTIRSNDSCKIDSIKEFVQSYYDEDIFFIEEEKDDFNENIDFCESFINYMLENMMLPEGLEFSIGTTDFGDYGIICMFDDSNIESILNFESE